MNVHTGNSYTVEPEWLPYNGSQTLHIEIFDYLARNPIASCIDTEDAANAEVQLERYVTNDGLTYLEFDRKYRELRTDGDVERKWFANEFHELFSVDLAEVSAIFTNKYFMRTATVSIGEAAG